MVRVFGGQLAGGVKRAVLVQGYEELQKRVPAKGTKGAELKQMITAPWIK